MVKAGLVGALFNMYVHVQHFSSIIGITEGANTCMEARRIEGTQVKGIGDGVVIEAASFRRAYPNQQRKRKIQT